LYLKSGTYDTILTNPIPSGRSHSDPTILAGKPGDTAIIRPSVGRGSNIILLNSNRSNITFRNLTLDGINLTAETERTGFRTNSATVISNLVIEHLDIKHVNGAAIALGDGVNGCTIRRNHLHDGIATTLAPSNAGIYHRAKNCTVEHNEIYGIREYGITIRSTMGSGTGNIYRYNIIRNSSTLISLDSGLRAVNISQGDNIFHSNLIYGNLGGGLTVSAGYSGNKIYNNTIYANRGTGISVGAGANVVEIKNNIVFGNGAGQISDRSGIAIQNANLTTDPLFADSKNNNFRLKTGSPAIDKGVPVDGVTSDMAGLSRPQGSGYDIGAYEYETSVRTTNFTTTPSPPAGLQAAPQ
jgi:hypothetical protein